MSTNTRLLRATLATVTLIAAAGLAACQSDGATTTETTAVAQATAHNTTCPISGGKVDAKVTSSVGGKTVAFCCAGCKGKFDKMSAKQQEELCTRAK